VVGLQGHVGWEVGPVATWAYLLFAFAVLPIYVPIAVLVLEPPGRRRMAMAPFVAVGTVVSGVLLAAMVRGPVTARFGHLHLSYGTGPQSGGLIVGAYVLATCGPLVFTDTATSPSSASST
jgi:hypothetical protein